jgi:hypothetical protein
LKIEFYLEKGYLKEALGCSVRHGDPELSYRVLRHVLKVHSSIEESVRFVSQVPSALRLLQNMCIKRCRLRHPSYEGVRNRYREILTAVNKAVSLNGGKGYLLECALSASEAFSVSDIAQRNTALT